MIIDGENLDPASQSNMKRQHGLTQAQTSDAEFAKAPVKGKTKNYLKCQRGTGSEIMTTGTEIRKEKYD